MTIPQNKISIEEGFCYPKFPIRDNDDLIISLRFTEPQLAEHTCTYSEIQKFNIATKLLKWRYKLEESGDYISSRPIIVGEKLIVTTKNFVIALNKNDGIVLWKMKFKLWTVNISFIDNFIFLANDNEITVLNVETGKKVNSKKYRVKWLDSPLVKHNGRLFISTSNSKIIEISSDTLEIIHEFKYPGGWAIASTPDFSDNLMLANSYSAYVACFDLTTNATCWKVKKQAGTEPKQLIDIGNDLFFVIEILQEYRLTAFSIQKGKKKWSHNYHIHDLKNLNTDYAIGLLKNKEGQYSISLLNKKDGNTEKEIHATEYKYDDRFQYRLWKGAELLIDNEFVTAVYSPNEIFIWNKKEISQ